MDEKKIKAEHYLYWLAFLLALTLRLYQLGAAPLTNMEAGWALKALGVAHGSGAGIGAQPAYILLTSLLFSILGDSNFLARLFPALAGSLLVWLPFLFQRWMGDSRWLHRAGVVMAFGMAIDPALVSLSRQAGSLMPALVFILLALACLYNRHLVWLGIFAGLTLLSGLAFLQGLLIIAICWGLSRLAGRKLDKSQFMEGYPDPASASVPAPSVRVTAVAFFLTLLFAGSLFLRAPQGLGALVNTIPDYLNTWVTSSGIPVLRLPASLLVYQPLVLVFGIIGAVRAWFGIWESQQTRQVMVGFSIWALVGLVIPLLYAGRQVGDMAWALIPLWVLAAVEISRYILEDEDTRTRVLAACLGLFLFVLAVVGWINLLSIGRYQVNMWIYWLVIFGAFLLGVIAVLLVATTWSTFTARAGAVWALCIVLGLQLISNTWGMSIVHHNGAQELWSSLPATGQADLLQATLTDLSSRTTGLKEQMEIVALVDPPDRQWDALKWELRYFPNVRFETALSSRESPPVVITLKEAEVPSLAEKYRGQDFVWQLYPGWLGVFPPNFINWLAFRQAPLEQSQIILWARADIFPGDTSDTPGSAAP